MESQPRYRIHPKNSSTQKFIKQKSSVQVSTNLDEFLVPLISSSGEKVLFKCTQIVTNFRFPFKAYFAK